MSIDGQVIYSGGMVCEGTYLFLIDIHSCYYFLQENKSNNTIVCLGTIINVNVNVIFYYSKGVIPYYLRSILQNDYMKL